MKKLLVVGVIVLFLGLAIAPSINANVSKASVDSELVEITTEICGINGVTPNTVLLSKEDAEEVEKLFTDIQRKLDEVETREESVDIFNEAVVELDKYGLLGGLSVEQAQRLVTGRYQNLITINLLEKAYKKRSLNFAENENVLCLIAGITKNTFFMSLWGILVNGIIVTVFDLLTYLFGISFELAFIFLLVAIFITDPIQRIEFLNPVCIGRTIETYLNETWGIVTTYGLNGLKVWNGNLKGTFQRLFSIYGSQTDVAIVGFTGLKFQLISYSSEKILSLFLGFAPWVKIEELD